MKRKLNKDEYLNGVPDAKVVAMVNDLSPEALVGLVCLCPRLLAKVRQLIHDEYRDGNLQAVFVIEQWEADSP